MIYLPHLRDLVITPALTEIGLWSPAAVNLVLATAVVESSGRKLRQTPTGPALGLWQIEPATYNWLMDDYLVRKPLLRESIIGLAATRYKGVVPAEETIGNLLFAAAMCRVRYFAVPHAMPAADDILGLAHYYKTYYNTVAGAATITGFIDTYNTTIKRHAL